MNDFQQMYQSFINPLTSITDTDYSQGKDKTQTQHINNNKKNLKTLQRQF